MRLPRFKLFDKISNYFLICEIISYLCIMKLTLKIKLLPTDEQANLLLDTMNEANAVCNAISNVAWGKRIFNNFKLHHEVYHSYKATFKLSSQILVRCIAKVADAYKLQTLWEIPEPMMWLRWGIRQVATALDKAKVPA